VVDVAHRPLLLYAVGALAPRVDPSPYRRYPLPDIQIQPFDNGRMDLPALGRQHLRDLVHRANHDAVRDTHEAPAPVRLHHVRVEPLRLRHPPWLGLWSVALTRWRLPPAPLVRQQRR
jgi:hypothetical protein